MGLKSVTGIVTGVPQGNTKGITKGVTQGGGAENQADTERYLGYNKEGLKYGGVFGANVLTGMWAQMDAIRGAGNAREQGFDEALGVYAPATDLLKDYISFGKEQLGSLRDLLKDPSSIRTQPGYEFGLQEGLRGLQQQYAAQGKYFSGEAMRDTSKWASDYGTKNYWNTIKSLQDLVGIGYKASTDTAEQKLNLADLYAGKGQAYARRYEDTSKYIAGHEQAGRENFNSWFGGGGGFIKGMGGGMGG
jgi:hypothetical protein